jgi:DNA-binding response OmpR family regulator
MKVLLIDDSPMQQKIARIYLEKGEGYAFITANNGKEGVEKARLELPDLILLDVEMPEMDGEQALIALKLCLDTAEIPVIMCTACDDVTFEQKFMQLGAVGYIKKPHGFATLKNIVKDLVKNK